ncbi:pEARLI1-like lipid transfer protein 3 [Malania oleifera]|uniref:pEARLI1-like lipid transfer protein 3 n=1 Tax=Malania oleifera TaxID=397392 RepID=UPI0025ADA872|nr:pEARLI1-like lipid transfer protein 3 [Malania oleifera]
MASPKAAAVDTTTAALIFILLFATASGSRDIAHAYNTQDPAAEASCPQDSIKFGVCGGLLDDLLHFAVGNPPSGPCCSVLEGLADFEAAICLCTAFQANVLGVNLDIPISLNLLMNYCGRNAPVDFQCA